MKLPLFVFVIVVLQTPTGSSHGQITSTSAPQFEDFAVTSVFRGKPAKPLLSKYQALRTRIEEAARQGPNFAGHYTVVEWGCGSGCISMVIVDAISGRLYSSAPIKALGIPYLGTATGRDYRGLEYRVDSSLLIADGCLEDPAIKDSPETNCATRYYTWERNRFVLRASVNAPPARLKK